MTSGVAVNDECFEAYKKIKNGQYKYIIFKFSDDAKEIVVENAMETGSYHDFTINISRNEPRYAVCDFEYDNGEGTMINKIIFVLWVPDSAKMRQKILYTSNKDALYKNLNDSPTRIDATDIAEVSYNAVLEQVLRSA